MYITKLFTIILTINIALGGKEKKVTRKKPIAVTDPLNMKTLEEWRELGRECLERSCSAVEMSTEGTIEELARSLHNYYRAIATGPQTARGKTRPQAQTEAHTQTQPPCNFHTLFILRAYKHHTGTV